MGSLYDNVPRSLRNDPRMAWFAAIVVGGLIHLALWPLSEPPVLFSDFKKAYWVAGVELWNEGFSATYPFTIQGNWSNLPVLAWPFALLVPFGQTAAGWIYLGVGLLATGAAWWLLCRVAGLRGPMAAALLFLFFLNGPLLNTLREGNSTHFVLFFLVLGVAFWQGQRGYLAGLAFGMAATIKPALLLVGVYFLLRRRWPIVAGGATTIALAGLLSLALFGVAAHVLWFQETIGYNMGQATPAFNAQSIDGFLIRLSTGATELFYWGPIPLPTPHKIARYIMLALMGGGFIWLMLRAEMRSLISAKPGAPTPQDFLQLSIVLVFVLVISPLSWTHYYAYLLLPLGLYLGGKLPLPGDAATRWLFWPGYALASLPVVMPALNLNPDPPQAWHHELIAMTVVSAWLFGALLMLACFARGGWLAVRDEASSETVDARGAENRAA